MNLAISLAGKIVASVFGAIAGIALIWIIGCLIAVYILVVKPLTINPDKPSDLMGPDFLDYCKTVRPARLNVKKIPFEKVNVVTDDGLTLRGRLYKTDVPSDITIICLHGYNSNCFVDFSAHTLDYLACGYNVLHVTHRHHGDSDGKVVGFATLDRYDVLKWVDAVNRIFPNGKIFITGISMGGATAMQCSCLALPSNVKGIIADCGYTNMKEEYEYIAKRYLKFVPKLTYLMMKSLMKLIAGYSPEDSDSVNAVAHAKCPMLFIAGGNDNFVPAWMTERAYEACSTAKELVVIPGAGHAQAHYKNRELYLNSVKAFIDKYK